MAVDIHDLGATAEAIRLLVQSKLKLTANCSASATVSVGSTWLFVPASGPPVYPITGLSIAALLDDSDSAAEAVTITQITDDTTLVLHQACAGTFTTAKSATIGLATPRVTLGASARVTEDYSRWQDAIENAKLPAIAVMEGAASLPDGPPARRFPVQREFRVLYARQLATDEESAQVLKQQIGALVNLLAEDIKLGGTVDNAWVSGWDYRPQEDMAYFDGMDAVSVGVVTLQTSVYKLWNK